ncbi:MAG: M48 family metallopeptidase [Candidatus Margulisiibacteriota bacterium]
MNVMHPLADEIIHSNRHTAALEITPEAKLIVRLPKNADKAFIYTFIEAKRPWILKKKGMMAKQLEENSEIRMVACSEEDKEEAARLIKDRLDLYSSKMGVKYDSFKISGARKRWGVCCRRADIRINWRLAKAQEKILDYVIVHELSHIKEKNHSKRFWALVAQILPDHKAHRKWLRECGHRLHVQYN